MGNDNYERYGALTGLVAVVLFIVGFVIVLPTPPAPDAPASEVGTYYNNHQDAIRAAIAILSMAGLFFIWFLGSLSSALRSATGSPRLPSIAFGGGVASVTMLLVAFTTTATAAYRPDETSPELVRTLNDVALMVGGTATGVFVAFLAATAVAILRTNGLPHWLGWLSALGAVANLGTLGVFFNQTGAFAPDGVFGIILPFAGFAIPVAALSVVISQRVGKGGLTDRVTGAAAGAVDRVTGRSAP